MPIASRINVPTEASPLELRSRHVWAEGGAVGGCANVLRPAASLGLPTSRFELGTELKVCPTSLHISLRHPLHRLRQAASVVCAERIPVMLEGSGLWGAQRSELLGSDTNFAAAQSAVPCGPAEGWANLGSDPKNSGDSREAECPGSLIRPAC